MKLVKYLSLTAALALSTTSIVRAQAVLRDLKAVETEQVAFPHTIDAGDYSGITWLGGNEYAVVSDKAKSDGFFIFHINIDPDIGIVSHAYCDEYRSADRPNRDMEGIAFFSPDSTIFISGEADNRIYEYSLARGQRTGRELKLPDSLSVTSPNYGYESLAYNAATGRFWTVSESTLPIDGKPSSPSDKRINRLRLLSFDNNLQLVKEYPYDMEMPTVKANSANQYAFGVSGLCALDDGRLIVLEREFYVPSLKLGSFVVCKLYVVNPSDDSYGVSLHKKLLAEFKTRVSGVKNDIANYEGICLGPRLNDGRQTLVLISDSQHQYKGVMKDWIKTIIVE